MIISFIRATRCVRCKRSLRGEPLKASIQIKPKRLLGFRFRLCEQCADEMAEKAARNPNLTRIEPDSPGKGRKCRD